MQTASHKYLSATNTLKYNWLPKEIAFFTFKWLHKSHEESRANGATATRHNLNSSEYTEKYIDT